MFRITQNGKEVNVKLKNAAGIMVSIGVALLFSACQTTAPSGKNVKTFMVGPAMKDGVGVGPMTCLMVKQSPEAEYQMFYSPIRGFDYVPGFEYELKVEVTERENVPADASRFIYTLVEVVEKKKAGLSIDSTKWALSSCLSVSGTMDPPVEKSMVNMKIAEGKVTGNAGANRFFGGCEVEGSRIRISPTGSTMMMGTPELMAQEQQFLKHLQNSVDYVIVGEELRLRNAEGKVLLKMVPAVEPALTSGVWKATGINNGKGGVSSLLEGTEVTIQFDKEGRVGGNSGCNGFSGKYEVDGEALQIGPLAGTRKMGPEDVMKQEVNVLQALGRVSTYRLEGKTLELRSEKDALQVKFVLKEQ